jgi:hypothetical protein
MDSTIALARYALYHQRGGNVKPKLLAIKKGLRAAYLTNDLVAMPTMRPTMAPTAMGGMKTPDGTCRQSKENLESLSFDGED